MRETIAARIERGKRDHGDRFDASTLLEAPQLHPYYESDQRVEIDMYGDSSVIMRGRISTTTGRRPAFLLMLTRRSQGSIYLPDKHSRVLRVISD